MAVQKIKPGTLWQQVVARSAQARQSGTLQSLPTENVYLEESGIPFLVRLLATHNGKAEAKQEPDRHRTASGVSVNPFLPYEEELFVADLSTTHVCLLNKFQVVDHHLLIITRVFEDQESPLTLPDFEALWTCMVEYEALAFYNGGVIAGASQRHKHLQMVPLPLTSTGTKTPIDSVMNTAVFEGGLGTVPRLPFIHVVSQVDQGWISSPAFGAGGLFEHYQAMCRAVGLPRTTRPDGTQRLAPYNLLITREWMLLVPRSQEDFAGISINALGFAGTLLVSHTQQLARLKQLGPLAALKHVAIAAG